MRSRFDLRKAVRRCAVRMARLGRSPSLASDDGTHEVMYEMARHREPKSGRRFRSHSEVFAFFTELPELKHFRPARNWRRGGRHGR